MTVATVPVVPAYARRARLATYLLFFSQGVVGLSWVVRAPLVADQAGLSLGELGFGFSAVGLGSIVIIGLLGPVISRFGVRATAIPSIVVLALALALIGFAEGFPMFLAAVCLTGAASAAVEVCAATSASRLEHAYERPLMPSFVGSMTIGMLVGGLGGGLSIAAGLATAPYLSSIGIAVLIIGLLACPFLINSRRDGTTGHFARFKDHLPTPSWRLGAISLIVFVSALEAGLAGFSAIYLTQDLGASEELAGFAVVAQLVGMVAVQLSGDALRRRVGASTLVRVGVIVGAAVMFVALLLVRDPVFSLAALAVLGAGIALIYPAGLSAAADAQRTPAPGVATAQFVRYVGVFAVGPFIGFVSDSSSVTTAFTIALAIVVLVSVIFASALGRTRGLGQRAGGELPDLMQTGTVPTIDPSAQTRTEVLEKNGEAR